MVESNVWMRLGRKFIRKRVRNRFRAFSGQIITGEFERGFQIRLVIGQIGWNGSAIRNGRRKFWLTRNFDGLEISTVRGRVTRQQHIRVQPITMVRGNDRIVMCIIDTVGFFERVDVMVMVRSGSTSTTQRTAREFSEIP